MCRKLLFVFASRAIVVAVQTQMLSRLVKEVWPSAAKSTCAATDGHHFECFESFLYFTAGVYRRLMLRRVLIYGGRLS